jgi:hypothetical protein
MIMKIKKIAAKKNSLATKFVVKKPFQVVYIGDKTSDSGKKRSKATMPPRMAAKPIAKKGRVRTYDSLPSQGGRLNIGAWSRCATHDLQFPRGESCPKCP